MPVRFKNNLDLLSIRINGTAYKYCQTCGYQLQGRPRTLAAHYRRYHTGQEPAWLGYDERPADGCYANFEAHRANPETRLVLLGHIKYPGGGPVPLLFSSPFAISGAQPPVIEQPAVSDVESCFFKRSAVDLEMMSLLADFQNDGDQSRQIEQRCDQKYLKGESDHQRPSQSGPGQAQATGRAAVLKMDTGLAVLEVQPVERAQY